MATIITLYKQCKITKDRNAKVEGIAQYFNTFSSTNKLVFDNCQYQKIELNKNIKLELPQSQVGKETYNYLDIYQDTKHFYYFIDKANWKSTTTVEFECTLDTVNTFANDFTFNKKTHITRQHKDRIKTRYIAIPNSDYWEYPPVNKSIILNPWAYENEVHDIFKIQGLTDLTSCTVEKLKSDGTVLQVWNNLVELGQDYVGESGVAMYFKWHGQDVTFTETLEYADLINDFDNNIYYAIKFVGNVSDLVYSEGWQSLFYGILKYEYIRLVDQKEEGIEPPHFKEQEEYKIDDPNSPGNSWYLVYETLSVDEDSGIQAQLWPELPMSVKTKTENEFDPEDIASGTYYYIMPNLGCSKNAVHNKYEFKHGNANVANHDPIKLAVKFGTNFVTGGVVTNAVEGDNPYGGHSSDQYSDFCIVYKDSLSRIVIEQWRAKPDLSGYLHYNKEREFTLNATGEGSTFVFQNFVGNTINYYTHSSKITNLYDLYQLDRNDQWNNSSWTFTITSRILKPFNTIDRTDSKLVKIIKLPYSIVNIENEILDSSAWVFSADHLILEDKNAKFITELAVDYDPLEPLQFETNALAGDDINRNDIYESKIYNSEFYMPKFVYDSFGYQYMLENVDVDNLKDNVITYQATSTINSRFLFGFNVPLKRSTSDYDNICVIARNNEVPIYSNAYLNYIRTGYNYDVKNKNANLTKNVVGVAATAAGGALATGLAITKIGAAAGSSVGPVGTAIGAGVGAVIGLATGLITMAINQSQADNAIKQKLDEASRQATSVEGGDDIDLLDTYTDGNKAKYVTYRCSDKVRQTMLDLFYYCGYSEDVYGVPNLHTRKYFNYIECEPVFNEENNTVYGEFLNDIKERYKAGVTVYHNPLVGSGIVRPTWDWNQEKENWETNLL